MLIVFLSLFIFFCLFKLYIVGKALDDVIIVLIEQVWTLQLLLINSFSANQLAVNWSDDALSIKGSKGELLIRRYSLLKEWGKTFTGVVSEVQFQIETRIKQIDDELVRYSLHLHSISTLTLKMIYDIYHGDFGSSSNVTMNIIQKLRLL